MPWVRCRRLGSRIDDTQLGRLPGLLARVIHESSPRSPYLRLFLNTLDSVGTVRKLVAFYVEEHNQRLPHSAFRGQTPDEMYFGNGKGVPDELDAGKKAARQKRLELNRALSCAVREPGHDSDAA